MNGESRLSGDLIAISSPHPVVFTLIMIIRVSAAPDGDPFLINRDILDITTRYQKEKIFLVFIDLFSS